MWVEKAIEMGTASVSLEGADSELRGDGTCRFAAGGNVLLPMPGLPRPAGDTVPWARNPARDFSLGPTLTPLVIKGPSQAFGRPKRETLSIAHG